MTELRTLPEAMERLRVSRRTIYRLINQKKLHVTKVGGGTFFTDAELERYIRVAQR